MVRKVWVSHSGGKDSMLALHRMMNQSDIEVVGLLTTITEGYERSTTHGIREELVDLQAELLGLPMHKVFLPKDPSNENYNQRFSMPMKQHGMKGFLTLFSVIFC